MEQNLPNVIALADFKHDLDGLKRFTSDRWLWNERQQLEVRYINFDMAELLKVAALAIDADSCAKVVKASEGQYNKVFQLTMNDGREVIAKLPNFNAGREHFSTASEVATMDFPGTILSDIWGSIKGKRKAQIVQQVVEIERSLASTKFTKFGALYYKQDLPGSDNSAPLYVDGSGNVVHNTEFVIGPTNHRSFFDFGKGGLNIDCGPWSTITEYLTAVAHREIACVKAGLTYPVIPEGLFYGPRQYQPTAAKKLSALNNYLKVAPYVLPEDKEGHASVLWHGDLHTQNIFVDPEDPGRIVGIIDWQSVSACPIFMQVTRPGFLDYNGPAPEDLGRVSLPPNFDSMSPEEQREAKSLHESQTLHNLYLALSFRTNSAVFQAIQGHDTLHQQVSILPGLTLTDCEPCLNSLLREVKNQWPTIVGEGPDGQPTVPCPLQFSATEVEQQENDVELWAQGVELMNNFISESGCFKHWDGRVDTADYDLSKKQLAEGIEKFLSREARNDEERKAWLA